MNKVLRLLLAEDSASDGELVIRQLRNAGYQVEAERVDDIDAMRRALAGSVWDLIVSDYHMPGFDARDALRLLQETGRDIPFVVVSGVIGEEAAVQMMRAGAHDYFMKGNLTRLGSAVERELRQAANRADARRSSERIAELNATLDHAQTIVQKLDGTIMLWNSGAIAL